MALMERGKTYKCVIRGDATKFVPLEGGEEVDAMLGTRLRVDNICEKAADLLGVTPGASVEGVIVREPNDHLRLDCNCRLPLMTFMGGSAQFALV